LLPDKRASAQRKKNRALKQTSLNSFVTRTHSVLGVGEGQVEEAIASTTSPADRLLSTSSVLSIVRNIESSLQSLVKPACTYNKVVYLRLQLHFSDTFSHPTQGCVVEAGTQGLICYNETEVSHPKS